jgi:tRNA threonylcarbamoyladenosine biosynthesis protein TsaE
MTASRSWKGLDEAQLSELAQQFATVMDVGVVYLYGDLGAGKTTFARAFLRASGVGERIKSPTYSLIESYEVGSRRAHHLDLYRIADPEELEWLALGELADEQSLLLVEWPQRGKGVLPGADLELRIQHCGEVRDLEAIAHSGRAIQWLSRLPA